jgi:hypothetical protein
MSLVAAVLLAPLAGCGGDDGNDNDDNGEDRAAPVSGTFVGKLQGSGQFVAVVAAPPADGQRRRQVAAFVCDGDRACSWFAGEASGNEVVAKSEDGSTAELELKRKAATGSVELPTGKEARYNAREATAVAGLYDLAVSRKGKLSGASASGVGLTGSLELPPPASGRIKLADGTRLKFRVVESKAGGAAFLRPGQLRLIVLPNGAVRGAGTTRGDGGSKFLVRSVSK